MFRPECSLHISVIVDYVSRALFCAILFAGDEHVSWRRNASKNTDVRDGSSGCCLRARLEGIYTIVPTQYLVGVRASGSTMGWATLPGGGTSDLLTLLAEFTEFAEFGFLGTQDAAAHCDLRRHGTGK